MNKKAFAVAGIMMVLLMASTAYAAAPVPAGDISYEGPMPPVLNLTTGVTESDVYIRVWDEQQNITLTADLEVDILQPGTYTRSVSATPGVIPSGSTISSYILHFDEDGGQTLNLAGSITFDAPILGLIMGTNPPDLLVASDGVVGIGTTTYDPGGTTSPHNVRGLETFDSTWSVQDDFTLSADRLTVSVNLKTAGGIDEMRIIVQGGPLLVDIDIKPGSDPNCFNSDGHGVIPVAILGSDTFDASTVDPFSVTLDGAEVRVKGKSDNAGSLEDVNGDGFLDLVLQIMDDSTYTGDAVAVLTGETFDGQAITGSDSVCIRPPE